MLKGQLSDTVGKKEEADVKIEEYTVSDFCSPIWLLSFFIAWSYFILFVQRNYANNIVYSSHDFCQKYSKNTAKLFAQLKSSISSDYMMLI